MRRLQILILHLLFFSSVVVISAVSYKGVHSYMITCANRNSLFVMISGHSNKLEEADVSGGYGVAYYLRHDGKLVETWRVEGWYADTTYLGGNGECLVRIWDRHRREENEDDDPAIAFYNSGELQRMYKEKELRKFAETAIKIPAFTGKNKREKYMALETCFLERSKEFMYVSPRGTIFYFDVKSGRFKYCADVGVENIGVRKNEKDVIIRQDLFVEKTGI